MADRVGGQFAGREGIHDHEPDDSVYIPDSPSALMRIGFVARHVPHAIEHLSPRVEPTH